MGYLGNPAALEVQDAIMHGLNKPRAIEVPAGMLEFDENKAVQLFKAGFSFVAIGGDGSLLARQTSGLANRFMSALSE